MEYAHDAQGRRAEKKVNGRTMERYEWLDRIRLRRVVSDGVKMEFLYSGGRLPDLMVRDGRTYRLYYDQVGTLRVVAGETGDAVKDVLYDSFGNVLEDANPAFRIPLGFAGGLYDPDTGLVRFGYRDYDPDTGRFTAPDPLGDAGGDSDWYGYCLDDPVNLVDPNGQQMVVFDGEKTTWYDANGTKTDEWISRSGPYGKGPLPDGSYTASNPRKRTKKGMVCPDGTGLSVDLKPEKENGRTDLRIHPDAPPEGTEGCIGVDCQNANATWGKFEEYFKDHDTLPVKVRKKR
ncbi:MAG: RHS repeat-associated core domain-containing protein [Desulfovibrionaceae bacterium]